jgi:hypothetical protein
MTHFCTRCYRPVSEKNAQKPELWLTYDQWYDVYRHYDDVVPAAIQCFPEMEDMNAEEQEDFMLEKCYHLGAFVFGPECVKHVAGREMSELRAEDKGKKNPKGQPYWGDY